MRRLETASIDWSSGSPVDPGSGDAWCDAADPRGEARHVFLEGNDLPARWAELPAGARARCTVAEIGLGFGRTLCELAEAFVAAAPPDARLHVLCIERAPLAAGDVARGLAWAGAPEALAGELVAQWPPPIAGVHPVRLAGGRVRVHVHAHAGGAAEILPQLMVPGGVDAWCLDGFAPARDESAWTAAVLAAVGGLTATGGTVATWSAAGRVRSGLAAAGFAVERRPGHGRKRDMTVGRMAAGVRPFAATPTVRRALVVGGGLAGSAVAASLADRGLQVTVMDSASPPPGGASANPRVIAEPVLGRTDTAAGRLRWTGWRFLLAESRRDGAPQESFPGGAGCGVLHGDRPNWRRVHDHLGAEHPVARWLDAAAASDVAGVSLDVGGLFVPGAGWLVPAELVARRLARVVAGDGEVVAGSWPLEERDHDVLVDATGRGVAGCAAGLPVEPARGQVSLVRATADSAGLRVIAGGRGACLPAADGVHLLASTFDHHDEDDRVREEDHGRVLDQLADGQPALARMLTAASVVGGWAGVRWTTPDRLPLVGRLPGDHGTSSSIPGWVTLAHGSRGVVGGAIAGELIAAGMLGEPVPARTSDASAWNPTRFDALMARRAAATRSGS